MQLTNPYPYKELKRTSVDGQRLYENPGAIQFQVLLQY